MTTEARKRWTLIVAILGLSIVIIDGTAVGVALPAIEEDLDATLADQQWIANAYLLALAALLLVGGSLGDLYGRKRIYGFGLIGFGITSLMCGLAPNVEALIAFRALQGATGALLVPGTLAIISAAFEPEERGRAIGQWAAWSGLAAALGPVVGGGLVDALSWRAVFLINVPVIAVTLALCVWAVEESRDPTAGRTLDVPGVVFAALGLGGVTYGLIAAPSLGWGSPQVVVALAGGTLMLIAFLACEARSSHPLMPLRYFRQGNFAAANAATLTLYAALSGSFFFIPIFLQGVGGYSALEAGAVLVPVTVIMLVLSPRAGAWGDRLGPRWFMAAGPVVAALGMLILSRMDADADYLTVILPGLAIFGLGLALTVAPLTTTVMGAVGSEHAGVASGINNMLSRVAGLLGIAVLGTIVATQFRSSLSTDRLPATASTAAADARDRPLAEAEPVGLAEDVAALLEGAVQEASVNAFQTAMLGAAVIALIGGVISAIWIRNPERSQPA